MNGWWRQHCKIRTHIYMTVNFTAFERMNERANEQNNQKKRITVPKFNEIFDDAVCHNSWYAETWTRAHKELEKCELILHDRSTTPVYILPTIKRYIFQYRDELNMQNPLKKIKIKHIHVSQYSKYQNEMKRNVKRNKMKCKIRTENGFSI